MPHNMKCNLAISNFPTKIFDYRNTVFYKFTKYIDIIKVPVMSDKTSKVGTPSTTMTDGTIPITDSSANIPFFKKSKPSKNKNIRKRKDSSAEEDDDSSAVITKERKLDTSNPFVQASKKGRRVTREEISDTYAANKSAVTSIPEDIATRSAEWDTETDRDAQALLEKKLAAEEVIFRRVTF